MNLFIAVIAVLTAISVSAVAETANKNDSQEKMKAKVVSRIYQATYGYRERCLKATPDATKEFESELAKFVAKNSNLMKLVTRSAYYKSAQSNFSEQVKIDPARDTAEKLARECRYLASLLRSRNDTEEGQAAVREYESILSK